MEQRLVQPSNVHPSIRVMPEGRLTETRPEQRAKALVPMLATLIGTQTVCKLLQSENAEFLMAVTVLGISTDVRLAHPEKAELPITVSDDGMVMLVSPQLLKAPGHITVMVEGIAYDCILLLAGNSISLLISLLNSTPSRWQ